MNKAESYGTQVKIIALGEKITSKIRNSEEVIRGVKEKNLLVRYLRGQVAFN